MAQTGKYVKKVGVQKLDTPSVESRPSILRLGPIALSYARFALRVALQSRWLGIKIDLDVAAENLPTSKGGPK